MNEFLGIPRNLAYGLIGVYGLLIAANLIIWFLNKKRGVVGGNELSQRVHSWWIMISAFTLAIVINRPVSMFFLGFISFLALKEYLSLIPTRRIDRSVLLWAYLAIPFQFYWAYTGWYGMYIVFIPVWMFLIFPMIMALRGETEGFLRAVGTLSWGLMMTVFTLSHMAYLLTSGDMLTEAGNLYNPVAGGAGLLFFLVFITQFNDVAQFVWGKSFGKTPITPKVSPKKTWEGFLGGLGSSAAVAALVGPFLTPMDMAWSAMAGAMIAMAGFIGDITISAVKRDLGVKDTGGLIPGHGGILDRVDSLTYAAPVFFHFLNFFYYP